MSKILILGVSGTGKTSSIGKDEKLGIEGLNPETTFIITATTKPLSFPSSQRLYKTIAPGAEPKKENGNRYASNDATEVAKVCNYVTHNRPEITTLVLDDANYLMQDYYMDHADKPGYGKFEKVGKFMSDIFKAMEEFPHDFIMLAHPEEFRDSSSDTISYKFKTIGAMVDRYITPEGKFDVVLYTEQTYSKKEGLHKFFVTQYNGKYPAKSPSGMFEELNILNDLGLVKKAVANYYN